MSFVFPTAFDAECRGLAGKSGTFTNNDGETVNYSDALKFEFVDDEGVTQDLQIRVSQIDKVCGFDAGRLNPGDRVKIAGLIKSGDRGPYLALQSFTADEGVLKKLQAA